jgi:hypothetical protein
MFNYKRNPKKKEENFQVFYVMRPANGRKRLVSTAMRKFCDMELKNNPFSGPKNSPLPPKKIN